MLMDFLKTVFFKLSLNNLEKLKLYEIRYENPQLQLVIRYDILHN